MAWNRQSRLPLHHDVLTPSGPVISDSIIAWLETTCGEGNGTPLQYSCLENPMDGGAWRAVVHGVTKSQTRLSDFTFTFHSYALEKEMATHSSVLAWRIPGTGEPGGLPSMGSHIIGHDWSNLAAVAAAVANDPLYFCIVCCNLSFFISNFADLSLLPFFLDESGWWSGTFIFSKN